MNNNEVKYVAPTIYEENIDERDIITESQLENDGYTDGIYKPKG